MDQQQLNDYFRNIWKPQMSAYKYSGFSLVDEIKDDEWVIDVGCHKNLFKGKIKNLVGIDPACDEADVKTTIEDFNTNHKFDVAFCLGSVNFGSEETIVNQISKIVSFLKSKSRIYWRCNPGRKDHKNIQCQNIDFYNWTASKHLLLSDHFGYEIKQFKQDSNNRLFVEWIKNI
jgi:hypothetical protein